VKLSPAWVANAARRTLIACFPGLAAPDDRFAASHLPPAELGLYLRMDVRDRQHACEVAKRLLAVLPDAGSELVRAALLHDVGKAVKPYNPLHRILVHLYAPADIPESPRAAGLKGAWQVRRHHDLFGARMIREAGGSDVVADLVERHHRPGSDPRAQLLKSLDEAT
jgi:putative nucleotidyltransferase with HDIG domain